MPVGAYDVVRPGGSRRVESRSHARPRACVFLSRVTGKGRESESCTDYGSRKKSYTARKATLLLAVTVSTSCIAMLDAFSSACSFSRSVAPPSTRTQRVLVMV